ncbi:MAG: hypothetical protein AAEJ47_00885 [Planctomycetota bacterium]
MRQNAAPRSVFSPAMLVVSLALACCLLLASGMVVPESVMAQGEGRGPDGEDLTLLEFTKILVTKNEENGRYVITIIASAPKIPVGTKIDLLLTWRSQLVQTFTVTLPANRKLREELLVKKLEPSPDKYMFRSVIDPKKQTAKVNKDLEREKTLFPAAAAPWTEFHFGHQFIIGTAEEIEASLKETRAWFIERYTKMAKRDAEVRDGVKSIEAGTAYTKANGEFDEKKWRDFMDKKVISELVEMQEEIRKNFQNPRFLAHRLALSYLLELSVAVGKRSTNESKKLYAAKGLSPSPLDTKPEKLEVKVRSGRRIPRGSDLNDLVQKINKLIGLAPEENESDS